MQDKQFCFTCKHWEGNREDVEKSIAENPKSIRWQNPAKCAEIFRKIQVNVYVGWDGWDGGYVDSIETKPDFCCNLWETS